MTTQARRTHNPPQEEIMLYRQGDVVLTRVEQAPHHLTPVAAEGGLLILARGEATGHHHSVPASAGTLSLDEGGVMFLTIDELTAVSHQEHAPITLAPGTYRAEVQREWSDDLEPRPVQD